MPDSKMSDLFMFVTDENGSDKMKGESSMQVAKAPGEMMMQEFRSSDYRYFSNFFDVTDFEFNMELDGSDKSGASDSSVPHADWYLHKDALQAYGSTRSKDQLIKFKLNKVSGSFGKTVDSISPAFFESCCHSRKFKTAVLVKRAFTGRAVPDGDSTAQAYLRFAMTNMMITNISWSDGDIVEEKIRFKCEALEIKYRKQFNDGHLGGPMRLLKWEWSKGGAKT
jgi:type VI protein secretion system component Hcp